MPQTDGQFSQNIKLSYKYCIYLGFSTTLEKSVNMHEAEQSELVPLSHESLWRQTGYCECVFQQMSNAAATKPQPWLKRWLRWHRIHSGPGCRKGHSPSLLMEQMMLTPNSFPLSFNLWMKTMAWWHQNCSQSQSVKGLPQVHTVFKLIHHYPTRCLLKGVLWFDVCM